MGAEGDADAGAGAPREIAMGGTVEVGGGKSRDGHGTADRSEMIARIAHAAHDIWLHRAERKAEKPPHIDISVDHGREGIDFARRVVERHADRGAVGEAHVRDIEPGDVRPEKRRKFVSDAGNGEYRGIGRAGEVARSECRIGRVDVGEGQVGPDCGTAASPEIKAVRIHTLRHRGRRAEAETNGYTSPKYVFHGSPPIVRRY